MINRIINSAYLLGILTCLLLNVFCASESHALKTNEQPPVQLASVYDKQKVQDFLVSEKYDGIRAIWRHNRLQTRTGKTIHAPPWFTESWPEHWLDGELWIKRASFQTIASIVSKQNPVDDEWKQIVYMVFDAPAYNKPFIERAVHYTDLINSLQLAHIKPVKQFSLNSNKELFSLLSRLTENNAEGLMLHRRDSYFQNGRTNHLIKLKTYMDKEATVVSYTQGKGKYKGQLGALVVEYQDASGTTIRFKIGTGFNDQQRQHPPPIGSIVTFKYHGLTNDGIPRFASFLRVRNMHDKKP